MTQDNQTLQLFDIPLEDRNEEYLHRNICIRMIELFSAEPSPVSEELQGIHPKHLSSIYKSAIDPDNFRTLLEEWFTHFAENLLPLSKESAIPYSNEYYKVYEYMVEVLGNKTFFENNKKLARYLYENKSGRNAGGSGYHRDATELAGKITSIGVFPMVKYVETKEGLYLFEFIRGTIRLLDIAPHLSSQDKELCLQWWEYVHVLKRIKDLYSKNKVDFTSE